MMTDLDLAKNRSPGWRRTCVPGSLTSVAVVALPWRH
mgnify:CR=1 FL=1